MYAYERNAGLDPEALVTDILGFQQVVNPALYVRALESATGAQWKAWEFRSRSPTLRFDTTFEDGRLASVWLAFHAPNERKIRLKAPVGNISLKGYFGRSQFPRNSWRKYCGAEVGPLPKFAASVDRRATAVPIGICRHDTLPFLGVGPPLVFSKA